MEPVRSGLGGGVAATTALTVFLLVADVLVGGRNLFVLATYTGLCLAGGPPYCTPASTTALALTYVWFLVLYVVAWPLIFTALTWGLPGESGIVHGGLFGAILWVTYVFVVAFTAGLVDEALVDQIPTIAVTLVAYLVYGLVLGSVYDYLADHRTFMSADSE